MDAPLLIEVIPELAEELKTLLAAELGCSDLARQVAELRIMDRCQCGESSCATFYTAKRPDGAWGPGYANIKMDTEEGLLVLDVLHRQIVGVEILDRNGIKQKLDRIIPLNDN